MRLEEMPSDAKEFFAQDRRRLKAVFIQAKADLVKLRQKHNKIEAETSLAMSEVMEEMKDIISDEENEDNARERERLLCREAAYIGGQYPITEREIPPYDPLTDRHCTYIAGQNFLNSPFMKLKRAADDAVRFLGVGPHKEGSLWSPKPGMKGSQLSPLRQRPETHDGGRIKALALHGDLEDDEELLVSNNAQSPTSAAKPRAQTVLGPGGIFSGAMEQMRRARRSASPLRDAVRNKRRRFSGALQPPVRRGDQENALTVRGGASPMARARSAGKQLVPYTGHPAWTVANDAIKGLQRLREEVRRLRGELISRGLIPPQPGEPGLDDSPTKVDDVEWLKRIGVKGQTAAQLLKLTYTSKLIFQGRVKIRESPQTFELTVSLGESGWLEIKAHNQDDPDTVFAPLVVHPLFVDKLTGSTPADIADAPDASCHRVLRPVFDCLRLTENGTGLLFVVDTSIFTCVRGMGRGQYRVQCLRRPSGDGLELNARLVESDGLDGLDDMMTVVLREDELEVLFCGHKDVHGRANTRWVVQREMCEWLVARLRVEESDAVGGPEEGIEVPPARMAIDRSLPLPPDRSWFTGPHSTRFDLSATQDDHGLVLRCTVHTNTPRQGLHPLSTERITWTEVAAFSGAAAILQTPKQALSGLCSMEGMTKPPLEVLLERVTVSPTGVINVSRTLYEDTRTISGFTVVLVASVVGHDILYEARRLRGAEEKPSSTSPTTYTRLVPEAEFVRLLLREAFEVRHRLFEPMNRMPLCRFVADTLRLVCVEDGPLCASAASSSTTTATGASLRLETALYMSTDTLHVAIHSDDEKGEAIIGSVRITARTTLCEVRAFILLQLDPKALPEEFVFEVHGAPASLKQEETWLASDCLPKVFLVPPPSEKVLEGFLESAGGHAREGPKTPKRRRKGRSRWGRVFEEVEGEAGGDGGEEAGLLQATSPLGTMRRSATRHSTKRLKSMRMSRRSQRLAATSKIFGDILDGDMDEAGRPLRRSMIMEDGEDGFGGRRPTTRDSMMEDDEPEDDPNATVAVPLMARVTCNEDDRRVITSEDLTAQLEPGDVIKLENASPLAPEYVISEDTDDEFSAHVLTLETPFHHFVEPEPVSSPTAGDVGGMGMTQTGALSPTMSTASLSKRRSKARMSKTSSAIFVDTLTETLVERTPSNGEASQLSPTRPTAQPTVPQSPSAAVAYTPRLSEAHTTPRSPSAAVPLPLPEGLIISTPASPSTARPLSPPVSPSSVQQQQQQQQQQQVLAADARSLTPPMSPSPVLHHQPQTLPTDMAAAGSPRSTTQAHPTLMTTGHLFKTISFREGSVDAASPSGVRSPVRSPSSAMMRRSMRRSARRTMRPPQTEFKNVRIFRVVLKSEDPRPPWRVAYEDEKFPYQMEYKSTMTTVEVLGVKMRLRQLEEWCQDELTSYHVLHQQRVDYVMKVDVDKMVRTLFSKLTTGAKKSELLPLGTWQAFLEELRLLPRKLRIASPASKVNALLDPIGVISEDRKLMVTTYNQKTKAAAAVAASMGSTAKRQSAMGGTVNLGVTSTPTKTLRTGTPDMEDGKPVAMRWSDYVDEYGRIDYEGFKIMLRELAGLHYPRLRLDATDVVQKLLLDKVLGMKDFASFVWGEAKRLAMENEAIRCAVTIRLQAQFRQRKRRRWYLRVLRCFIRLQARWRRAIHRTHYKLRLQYMEEDRCIRVRHISSIRIQTRWRTNSKVQKYRKVLEERDAAIRKRNALRRARQHEKRRARESARLFRTTVLFNSVPVLITIFKGDGRRHSKNCDLEIRCYLPHVTESLSLEVPEEHWKEYVEKALCRPDMTHTELLDLECMKLVAERVLVREFHGRYTVVFSRRTVTERGVKVARIATHLGELLVVVTVYKDANDWVFRAYDHKASVDLRATISFKMLRKWLQDEERKVRWKSLVERRRKLTDAKKALRKSLGVVTAEATDAYAFVKSVGGAEAYEAMLGEEERALEQNFEPAMLEPVREKELVRWMVARMSVVRRKGDRRRQLVMQYDMEKLLKNHSAERIQGMYHMVKAKQRVRLLVRARWEKQMDRKYRRLVYVDMRTQRRRMRKLMILGPEDLPDPKDEYRPAVDPHGNRYWFNPATGQSSLISPNEAAHRIQKLVRAMIGRELGRSNMKDLAKSVVMIRAAPQKYDEFPDRLTCILNYAMVLHSQEYKWAEARPLFLKAMKVGGDNPVVMRAYAIFVLAYCAEESRNVDFRMANTIAAAAESKDPGYERFKIAIDCFYKWALVVAPRNTYALLNWAIVHQVVTKDYEKAELYYRRALSISPYDPRVLTKYNDFLKARLPGGVYASSGPSMFVVRRSETMEKDQLRWGEWVRLRDTKPMDPKFEKYWYDTIRLKAQWVKPDFKEHLKVRLRRSTCIKDVGEWKQYHDPAFKGGFVFWSSTYGELRLEDPFK